MKLSKNQTHVSYHISFQMIYPNSLYQI